MTSSGSLLNDWKNGCPLYSVLLRNENDNNRDNINRNAEFSAVLSEYTDAFPEELPKSPPNEGLEIEFKDGAKPIKKGL